jgi:hypothetical protein
LVVTKNEQNISTVQELGWVRQNNSLEVSLFSGVGLNQIITDLFFEKVAHFHEISEVSVSFRATISSMAKHCGYQKPRQCPW